MAVGTIVLGEDSVITASADGIVTGVPVSDINSYSYPKSRTINNFAVFQRTTAHGVPGARETSLTLSGLYSLADDGQDIIRAADEAGTTVFIELLPDGTNGIQQEFRVGSVEHSGTPENPAEVSFELAAAGDPTVVGTGL